MALLVAAIAPWLRLPLSLLWPWVRIPSTPSMLFSIYIIEIETIFINGMRKGRKKEKEVRFFSLKK